MSITKSLTEINTNSLNKNSLVVWKRRKCLRISQRESPLFSIHSWNHCTGYAIRYKEI